MSFLFSSLVMYFDDVQDISSTEGKSNEKLNMTINLQNKCSPHLSHPHADYYLRFHISHLQSGLFNKMILAYRYTIPVFIWGKGVDGFARFGLPLI
jgi:hypothetical protein